MMVAFETARGPFPRAKPIAVNAGLAALGIPRLNELRLQLGWGAFRSRRSTDLGALEPARFRALTDETVRSALEDPRSD
jgi:hypothetical protein